MNNEQLRNIRNWLRNQTYRKYDDVEEPESTLDMMEMSQELGEAHTARRLLEILPEPESEVVVKYRSLYRVWDEIDDYGVKREIYSRMAEIENEAREVIESRIEVEQDGQEIAISDPITSMKFRHIYTSNEASMDELTRYFVDDVLHTGVKKRP